MYSSGREVFLATARGESEGEQCDQTITSTAAGLLKRDTLHRADELLYTPPFTLGQHMGTAKDLSVDSSSLGGRMMIFLQILVLRIIIGINEMSWVALARNFKDRSENKI